MFKLLLLDIIMQDLNLILNNSEGSEVEQFGERDCRHRAILDVNRDDNRTVVTAMKFPIG